MCWRKDFLLEQPKVGYDPALGNVFFCLGSSRFQRVLSLEKMIEEKWQKSSMAEYRELTGELM